MDAVCKMEKDLKKKTWKPLFDEKDGNGYLSYKTFHKNPRKFRFNQLLDIGQCTNALHLFKENLPELRRQFQFKDNILKAARNALQQVKANFSATKILFVGIHCRWDEFMDCNTFTTVFRRGISYPEKLILLVLVELTALNTYNQAMSMFRYYFLSTRCLRPNFQLGVGQIILKVQHSGSNTTKLTSMLYSLQLQTTQVG